MSTDVVRVILATSWPEMNAAHLKILEIGFVNLDDPESDDAWASSLRRDFLDAGAEDVQEEHSPAPDGSRAVDGLIAGLIVKAVPGTVALIVQAIRSSLRRSSAPRRISVRIDGDELVLDGATSEEQDQLVAAFVARHSPDDVMGST